MNVYGRITAVGVFDDRRHAHLAIDELVANGFSMDQIGLVIPDDGHIEAPKLEEHSRAAEGAAAGAVAGGSLGALAGAAAALAIPGIGPVIAGGLLAGALTGVAGGGLLGALIGLSVPEEEAQHHENHLRSGKTIVTVKAEGRFDEALAILQKAAAEGEGHMTHQHRISGSVGPGPGSGSVFPGG